MRPERYCRHCCVVTRFVVLSSQEQAQSRLSRWHSPHLLCCSLERRRFFEWIQRANRSREDSQRSRISVTIGGSETVLVVDSEIVERILRTLTLGSNPASSSD